MSYKAQSPILTNDGWVKYQTSEASGTISIPNANVTETISYTKFYKVNVVFTPNEGISNPASAWVEAGNTKTFELTPFEDYYIAKPYSSSITAPSGLSVEYSRISTTTSGNTIVYNVFVQANTYGNVSVSLTFFKFVLDVSGGDLNGLPWNFTVYSVYGGERTLILSESTTRVSTSISLEGFNYSRNSYVLYEMVFPPMRYRYYYYAPINLLHTSVNVLYENQNAVYFEFTGNAENGSSGISAVYAYFYPFTINAGNGGSVSWKLISQYVGGVLGNTSGVVKANESETIYVEPTTDLDIQAHPVYPYRFNYWKSSGPIYFSGYYGNVLSINPTEIEIYGTNASVTAYYQYSTHVTFEISAPWYVDFTYTITLNGKNYSGSMWLGQTSTKTFYLPPGTYSWSIHPVKLSGTAWWWSYSLIAVPSSGFATTSTTIHINYVSPNDVYNFTWYESGLPNGTQWGITVDGNTLLTTGTSITETFVNGTTNSWNIIMPSGYDAVPYTGLFTNAGSVTISFIQPHVSISASSSSGEVPLTVTYIANVTGGSRNYEYDFFYEANNGSEESTGWQNSNTFTYTYKTDGIFETSVEVFDKTYGVAIGYASTQVEITAPPLNVSLQAFPTTGLPPLNVTFVSHISGGTKEYNFTLYFGNGGTSDLANVTYTYTKVGTYYAILEVTSGTQTVYSNSIPITVFQPPPITANLSASTTVVMLYSSDNFSVTAKGGSGLYYFTFYVNNEPVLSTSKPVSSWNFSYTFDTAGQSVVYVKVEDAIYGSSYSAQTNSITIYVLYS